MKKILSISLLFTIIFNSLLFASAADEYGAGIYTKSLYSDTYTAFVRGFGEDKDNVFLAIKKQRPQNEDIIAAAKEYLPDSNNAVSYFRLDGYDKETNDFVPLREVPKLKIMITVPFNGYFKHMGKDYKVLHYEDGKITELEIVERETNTAKVTFLSDKLGYFILSYNTKYLDFTFWFDEDMDAVYKKIENVSNYYEIEFPEPPEKKGYIFDGWWYYYPPNPHYTVELEEGTLRRDSGRGAFARWKKISESSPLISVKYTVTFVTEEGMLAEEQTVEENTCASEPQAPTRDGFEFAGWYTDKELTEKYDFDTPETNCQGLFNQVYKEVTFCGLLHGADA